MRQQILAEPDLEVRPPLGGRLAQMGLAAIGSWMALLVTVTLAARGNFWALLAGTALVVWVVYFYRLLSVAVTIRGDILTVRNLLRTRHVIRSSVREVTLGQSSLAKLPNQTVVIRTRSGQQLPLDACARSTQSPRKSRRVEEFHRRVQAWSTIELPVSQAGGRA
jgi:hypothetical protein